MLKSKSAIPNMFTFANLSFGIMSLMMSFQENYMWASIFILLAGLADRYDGRVARFLQVSSDLGKELDSLADVVSFGVAPSILIFNIYNFSQLGIIGYLFVLLLPISGAYRLARFNSTSFNGVFCGIPITLTGTVIAFYSLITLNNANNLIFTIILIITLSYLMVSNIKLKKM